MTFISALLASRKKLAFQGPETGTVLNSPRLLLRLGLPSDWAEWQQVRASSRAYLTPFEPTWAKDALSYEHYCATLRRQWREWREDKGYCFFIFLKEKEIDALPDTAIGLRLVGGIAINDLLRGISQKGTLGYWMDQRFAGQGLMSEAAGLVCAFAFATLRLHRLEAACLPRNKASARVLEKTGFTQEGYAHHYMRINGRWEDHLLWGRVNNESA